jgi:type I restriction enzyme, S subunit
LNKTVLKLGDAVEILSGFAYEAELFNESEGLPVIRIRDVNRGFSNTRYRGQVDKRFVVENGEILIGMDGNFNAARWRGGPSLLNQRVCKIKAHSNILDEGYLFHLLPKELKKIEDATAFVTVKHLSVKGIRDINVSLPPLTEQRRIADILDQADAIRTKRREVLAQLDSLTQSIFIEMFGDPVANPKGWVRSDVGSLSKLQGGVQVTTARKNLPLELPYLRVANVYRARLDLTEMKTIRVTDAEMSRTALVKGDLLIVEGHGNPNEVGRSALWTGEITPCTHQNHIIRVRFDCSKILPIFACEYLNSPTGRRHLAGAGKTTSGLNTINASNVRGTPILVPPIALQHAFAKKFEAVKAMERSHQLAVNELDALFESLQHRAFQGQL